eukprot:CAMPEP_0116902000 /NCGR_PEP_ID=MMETSP0467-20121206/9727_1 /TAXON_ID=283647 /ORGANISM="Mesodinium pulex, Strain SPMC105" /LENGTH=308 /DNA_ID=CAMNT_0004575699 /DNA_START=319 /DNA_END=1245 /DNA_ORIENTATION=+
MNFLFCLLWRLRLLNSSKIFLLRAEVRESDVAFLAFVHLVLLAEGVLDVHLHLDDVAHELADVEFGVHVIVDLVKDALHLGLDADEEKQLLELPAFDPVRAVLVDELKRVLLDFVQDHVFVVLLQGRFARLALVAQQLVQHVGVFGERYFDAVVDDARHLGVGDLALVGLVHRVEQFVGSQLVVEEFFDHERLFEYHAGQLLALLLALLQRVHLRSRGIEVVLELEVFRHRHAPLYFGKVGELLQVDFTHVGRNRLLDFPVVVRVVLHVVVQNVFARDLSHFSQRHVFLDDHGHTFHDLLFDFLVSSS